MLKHCGGQKAGKGTYWNFTSGERYDVKDEIVLPGDKRTIYFRLPATGILVIGPILGLLYAAFLPFIGIAMLLKLLAEKVAETLGGVARSSRTFGWRPSESYLAGKKRAKKDAPGKGKASENKDRE